MKIFAANYSMETGIYSQVIILKISDIGMIIVLIPLVKKEQTIAGNVGKSIEYGYVERTQTGTMYTIQRLTPYLLFATVVDLRKGMYDTQ
jgi:hypothetical protein